MQGAAKGRFGFYLFLPVRMAASVKIAALPQCWCCTREQMLREQSKKNECRFCPHPVSSGRVQRMAGLAHRAAITVLSARDKNVSFRGLMPEGAE